MFKLHEMFLTIQGETSTSGIPTLFIRFFGCPVGCSFCDQPQKLYRDVKCEDLLAEVKEYLEKGVTHVCITGGEPLVQPFIEGFFEGLTDLSKQCKIPLNLTVETSGCVPLVSRTSITRYIMDVKCPSSGVSDKNLFDNFQYLDKRDEVKFVIADREDFDYALSVIKEVKERFSNSEVHWLFSPMFDKHLKPVIGQDLANWIIEDGLFDARIQIQLHKILNVQ